MTSHAAENILLSGNTQSGASMEQVRVCQNMSLVSFLEHQYSFQIEIADTF
jgi:hypothetical protein